MPKKKTSAPAATKKSEPVEAEPEQVIEEAPVKQPTMEDRIAALEAAAQITEKNFEIFQVTLNQLQPLINMANQIQQKQQQMAAAGTTTQGMPAQGGFDIDPRQLFSLVAQTMGSGGGDSEFMELAKESMRADIAFTKSLKGAIIGKITGSATSEVAKAAVGQ